jgi:hypothetical protein
MHKFARALVDHVVSARAWRGPRSHDDARDERIVE